MQKLLETYRQNPTLKNAQAVIKYGRKHPFAACFITTAESDLIIAAGKQVNGEG